MVKFNKTWFTWPQILLTLKISIWNRLFQGRLSVFWILTFQESFNLRFCLMTQPPCFDSSLVFQLIGIFCILAAIPSFVMIGYGSSYDSERYEEKVFVTTWSKWSTIVHDIPVSLLTWCNTLYSIMFLIHVI